MAEVEIYDSAYVDIHMDGKIIEKIREWLKKHPKPDGVSRRVWVIDVSISPWTYTSYQIIDPSASGVDGETVGAI